MEFRRARCGGRLRSPTPGVVRGSRPAFVERGIRLLAQLRQHPTESCLCDSGPAVCVVVASLLCQSSCELLLESCPANEHDLDIWRCFSTLLGQVSGFDHWEVASVPQCLGGLGLRSAARTAPAAYWASWADSVGMFRQRHRDVVASCKLHAQFLRLFSLHDDVNDAHRRCESSPKQKPTYQHERLATVVVALTLSHRQLRTHTFFIMCSISSFRPAVFFFFYENSFW